VFEQAITETANGIDMTVQKVVVAPSLTRIEICYPEDISLDVNWRVLGSIEIGNEVVVPEQAFVMTGLNGQPLNGEDRCAAVVVPHALQNHEGEWHFTILNLNVIGSEGQQAVVATMSALDLPITPMPQGGYTGSNEGGEALGPTLEAVIHSLEEQIVGPWEFTFELP
jgi:hypothetical protein